MAYIVPKAVPTLHIAAPVVTMPQGRGRPRIYHGDTLAVSFRVPASWREAGSRKAKQGKINLTKLFAIHYREYLMRPAKDTRRLIDEWEARNGPIIVEDEPCADTAETQ